MKKIFFIPLLLLANFGSLLKGQSSLGIDPAVSSYSYVATTYFNNVDFYRVSVKNYGPQNFFGNIRVVYAVDSANAGIFLKTLKIDSVTVNIPFGSSVRDSTNITIAPSSFRSGINTVVIWPRMSTTPFTTRDSLKLSVWVLGYADIHAIPSSEKVIVFPNPMQQQLFVANKDKNFIIEQVRIYDSSGRLAYFEIFKGSIDVSKLASGTYTLEFSDKTGKTSRYKVLKE